MNRNSHNAEYWIDKLDLTPHPEGGYFRETMISDDVIATDNLSRAYDGPRRAFTLIYYLLRGGQVSRLHRLKSDEIWNFYAGSTLAIHIITADGAYEQKKLGPDIENGESFQHIVKHGCWFGAGVEAPDSYALVGCFVSPGFDYADFEMGDKKRLLQTYPEHGAIIRKLMR